MSYYKSFMKYFKTRSNMVKYDCYFGMCLAVNIPFDLLILHSGK
jgi:hypothetical protein